MAGDFSRNTFDPRKHYSSVLMQQGRVQLDADWNEQQAIQQHHLETTARDVIGPSGAPSLNPGFAIKPLESGNFQIDPGYYYVDGILCENEAEISCSGQPDLPATQPLTTGFYLVYLDVWRRLITALDDPLIREVALGGPDTTTRLKTVWQVRVLPVAVASEAEALQKTELAEWNALIAPSTGMLNASTIPFAEPKPCVLPPSSGYQRLENQLYRVEIHQGGDYEHATFKWSRENASITTGIQKITGNVITVTDLGKDEILGFAVGQWVEIVDDEAELMQAPYSLAQIAKIDPSTREITLSLSSEMTSRLTKLDGKPGLKLRRWDQIDQTGDAASLQDGLSVKQALAWSELEGGIQVQFSEGSYRSGDYWLIPARTATGDIEWPRDSTKPESIPLFQSPAGIQHHYCRLALLRFDGAKLSVLKDCRQIFPPATEVTADYIGYTPSCNSGPQTVAAFLDTLFYRKEDKELAPLLRALLSLKGRDVTVREGLNWLAEALEKRTGMVTVGEGGCYEDLTKAFEALASTKDYEVALLLLPGEHKLPADYITPGKCSSIKLEGAGARASTIQLNGNLTLKAEEIILSDLTIQATRNRQSITLEGEKITATRCSFNKNINNFLAARILGNTQKYGESSLTVNSLAVDKDNNILVAGMFHGMVNFGGGELTTWENDIFVAKYNSKLEHYKSLALTDMHTNMQPGNILSVKDMAVDDQDNILITGQLLGMIKFKFDDSNSYLSSAKEDGFIAKLNSELGYSKLRLLAKTEFYENSMFNVVAMVTDQDEILIIGDFLGIINFGELDANKLSSTTYNNSFIVRLGSDLKYINSACISSTSAVNVTGIAVSKEHQIFVTGKGSEGGFIVKLDNDLKSTIPPLQYILKTEQNSMLTVSGIAIDNENNILVTGKFMGTVTMKSGDKLTSSLEKGFIVKLTPDLNLYRTRTLDGVFDRISRISIDVNGNVVLTGIFSSNVSFEDDSDNNSVKLSSQVPCGFIVVFDRYLKPLWARSSNTKAVDLAIDNVGNIVVAGQFRGALKLGDDSTAELKSEQEDGFIAKFGCTESPLVNIETPLADKTSELKFADNHMEVLWSWKDNTSTSELTSKPWEGLVLANHHIGGSIQDNYILGQVTLRGRPQDSSVDQFIPLDSQTISEGIPSAINAGKNIQLKGNEIYCMVSKIDRMAKSLDAPNVIMATNNIFTANENSFVCKSLTFIANYFPNTGPQEVAATVIGRSGIFVGNAAQDRGATIMRNLVEKEWIANLLSYVDPSVSLLPASMSFKPDGSTTGEISVTATGNWSIEVEKNVDWINLMPPSSQSGDKTKVSYSGNATVKYTVLPNWNNTSRTTTLRIASSLSKATLAQFTITQAGLSVTPTEIPFVVQGGSGDIKVSAPPAWEAKSNVDWIKISAVDNSVDGLVRYQVSKNTGQNLDTSPRTGTMTIARQTVTIKQVGGSLSLDRLSDSFDQNGGERTVQVVKATPGHEWEAKPSASDTWIIIQSGAKGIGDGSFSYKVISLPTGVDERRGVISVNSQTFSITQKRSTPTETG